MGRYTALPDAKIRQIQQMLQNKRLYLGRVDGDYQDQTKKAVMWYQQNLQRKGLYKGQINGLWDNQTEAAYQKDARGNLPKGNVLSYAPQPQNQPDLPWPRPQVYVMRHPKPKPVPKKYPNHPLAKNLACPGDATGTDDCAKYRNEKLRAYGINLWGNAWQEGGTPVFNGFVHSGITKPKVYDRRAVQKYNEAASEAVLRQFKSQTLDPTKVYTVNMYYRGSPAQQTAFRDGENSMTGTHTGILIYKDGDWYVNHNIHGKDYEEKFTTLQGRNTGKRYGVTAISDPSSAGKKKNGGKLNLNRPYVTYFKEI